MDLFRGDTLLVNISVTQDNQPFDLTGATLFFTAKLNLADSDDSAKIKASSAQEIEMLDALKGKARLTIAAGVTANLTPGTLLYDLQVIDEGGEVFTVAKGTLTVLADITRRTSP